MWNNRFLRGRLRKNTYRLTKLPIGFSSHYDKTNEKVHKYIKAKTKGKNTFY